MKERLDMRERFAKINKYFYTLILLIIFSSQSYAAMWLIEEKGLLGIYKDTSYIESWDGGENLSAWNPDRLYSESDNYIITVANSLLKKPRWNSLKCKTKFSLGYGFKELDNIKLYKLTRSPCEAEFRYWIGGHKHKYIYIMFNQRDSSFYGFNGTIEEFSKVFRPYLNKYYNSRDKMVELIYLFLNANSDADYDYKEAKFILNDADDFSDIFKTYYKPPDRFELYKKIVNIIVKPLEFKNEKDKYKLIFYSWYDLSGAIELWKFEIDRDSIRLIDYSKTILKKVASQPQQYR